jgi:site-specific DNA recombinase
MRVRPYIRRSHEREGGVSLEVQRHAITLEVARRGWALDVVEYIDDNRSAFRDDIDNRPSMQQALADAKRREFDVVMVYKWDRLARSEAIFHGLIAEFKKCNVSVVSATEGNDLLAPQASIRKVVA